MATIHTTTDDVWEIEQGGEWVTTNLPQPDPLWHATDSNGHEHAYQEGKGRDHYPTLRLVRGEPYWCDDCRDEHTDSWYVCRQCEEKVVPGTHIDSTPKWIGGLTVYRLNGEVIPAEQAKVRIEQGQQKQREQRQQAFRTSPHALQTELAMRDEGLSEDQIQRVLDRMASGQ